MKKAIVLLFISQITLMSCATPYQQRGLIGGFADYRLNKNTFRISFTGNAWTSQEKVEMSIFYRCAELTVDAGFDYFIFINQNLEKKRETISTPSFYSARYSRHGLYSFYIPSGFLTMERHDAYATIKCFQGQKSEDDDNAFDAHELIEYLGPNLKN